ncbi:DNA polymerase III epsilon subunit [hydrothermal vent metagenome]|uniref:DNA polymerase III subunit epsilon n=1 Tax=hydrothermal vent metagenome TaxID=652676 RepID=A0A1W1BN90_9ZZZZ
MQRLIILDTETTGIDPKDGHRIIEIGCVEIINREVTNNQYQRYINPNKNVGDSMRIHGLSDKFLSDKPIFKEVVKSFLDFIKDDTLVIHNAGFDMGFLNNELALLDLPPLKNPVIDTLELSKKQHISSQHSLDALCRRYEIDKFERELHGALLDSQILAEVYLAMTGGQKTLFETQTKEQEAENNKIIRLDKNRPALNVIKANDEELANHNSYFKKINGVVS